MNYIVFDLEFNQDMPSLNVEKTPRNFNEIIQIGAIKLDAVLNDIASFNRYVKPTVYSKINPHVTELTGITTEQLSSEKLFPEVYEDYLDFIGEVDSVFCIWGIFDVKEIYKNAEFFSLDKKHLPQHYINIQPYVSKHLRLHPKKMLQLQNAVELLNIPKSTNFHNALYDAYYTAEIFKKVNNPTILPKRYDPSAIAVKPRRQKVEIDYDGLIAQIQKMADWELSQEEQELIKLAYKMGRTHQFIKP